ncbi:AraC family transcriptional regulator [Paenibacillus sp. GCM10023248]|uniref:AraC family transcriptional regulator n=1 Tax=Bacillales TaxID=1385 RepID=UPI002378F074|nr:MULTISPECIES: AraC family transcriptional regulator [Bacillales]MDD9266078.1 AraC family transcriptional regulator [Paenibacillus sp. MAHUQ-63]MDR6879228.1 AraC-like DNA-binding protein [Bacillus sp. 3255]
MNANNSGDNRKLYIKLLLSTILCTVLTLLVSSAIYFVNYRNINLNQVYQTDLENLTQTSREVISMTESAQSLTFQLYRNGNISKLMFYENPDIYDTTAAMRELSNYLNSMPYIDSIYVYNPKASYVYIASNSGQNGLMTKEELADKDILNVLDHFQEFKPFVPIPRTYLKSASSAEKSKVYTYLCYDAIGNNNALNSAIIVNISTDWINKDIGKPKGKEGSSSFIIDMKGRTLAGDLPDFAQALTPDSAITKQIMSNKGSGYFIDQVGGHKSLISYTAPDSLEWRYIRITSYAAIIEKINNIRTTTIYIGFAILLAGLLVSWHLSRKLYVPIDRIVTRMKALESDKRNSLFTLKQDVLRKLLQGQEPVTAKMMRDKRSELGISFDFQSDYRLILLRIDGFEPFMHNHQDDLHVYKYAIMNISSEIASQAFQVETVDIGSDSTVLLVNAQNTPTGGDQSMLQALLKQIQKAVSELLKISLSITYSPLSSQPQDLVPLYRSVVEASEHRVFLGPGCLIASLDHQMRETDDYLFTVEKEKKLIDALMAGKVAEAKKLYSVIIEETRPYPISVFQATLSRLTITLNGVLHTILKNNALDVPAGLQLSRHSLAKLETIEQIEAVVFEMFDDIKRRLDDKRSMKQDDLIRKINDMIEQHCGNPNLCLNWIADELDMSPIYLSRVYKQNTMNAVVDVINTMRMERAKDLLKHSDLPIADIAERIGYTNSSYFYRMFKKNFGVTPTDYRKSELLEPGNQAST